MTNDTNNRKQNGTHIEGVEKPAIGRNNASQPDTTAERTNVSVQEISGNTEDAAQADTVPQIEGLNCMNPFWGKLFTTCGIILFLTSLLEYALFRWTGDVRVLWSWLGILIIAFIWIGNSIKRNTSVQTPYDKLLALIWGLPALISAAAIVYTIAMPDNTMNPVGITQLILASALLTTSEFYRGKGSQQSGSFAALMCLGIFELIFAFNYTFRTPFDAEGGSWMLELAIHSMFLLIFPGLVFRHLTHRQCSKS